MKRTTEQALARLAETAGYFDLLIEYVADLPDNVPGFLQPGPDPRFILVNASKSPSEQAFTIAHEIGHYVMHANRPIPAFLPWYLNIRWQSPSLSKFSSRARRWIRRVFDAEWQADLWAFILLLQIGAADDVMAIIALYPKKTVMLWHSIAALIFSRIKGRTKKLFQWIPFRTQ